MEVFYKVIEIWMPYPFQQEIEERYILFSFSRKKFKAIQDLRMKSDTSIKEKEEYLMDNLKINKVKVTKIK